ncbi:uncharacterized protein I303_101443 [Kwoniella dejecticola CBS 10117]|uniref:Zn(2)-C6 fungal-type domain-containing protein n=1 Tax=Kwoniella dejecticola CBS 10117 TaxID=1296121 RepID=A0AAJ8MF27_9TREE
MPPDLSNRPRQLQSCLGCRGIKVKCVGNEDPNVKCKRCKRLNIDCVYSSQRRGRKTNVERAARSSMSAQPQQSEQQPRDPLPDSSAVNAINNLVQQQVLHNSMMLPRVDSTLPHSPILPLQPLDTVPPPASASAPNMQMSTPASVRSVNAAAPTLDVSEYLNPPLPDVVNGQEYASNSAVLPVDDIAARQYHRHLGPVLALLDPYLHTMSFMRETSVCLLSAVLAAACKFFRKDLYPRLIEHAQTLISREIDSGRCDVGIIQSLLILVCWKETTDRSAWVRIGVAIRLGYQHGWYKPSKRTLPSDVREARQLLNAERTWYSEHIPSPTAYLAQN